jgi:hypothetical protein
MMHGHEKSDSVIVAVKPANKAERSAAELVERRARAEGSAVQRYGFKSCLLREGSSTLGAEVLLFRQACR